MTRKSCLNCAYFVDYDYKYDENEKPKPWMGFTAGCHMEMWLVFLNKMKTDVIITKDFDKDDNRKSFKEIKEVMGDDFTISTIPFESGKMQELAEYKCDHYFPEKKRGALSRKKCLEEQLRKKANSEFIISITLSTLTVIAVVASAIFNFLDWLK